MIGKSTTPAHRKKPNGYDRKFNPHTSAYCAALCRPAFNINWSNSMFVFLHADVLKRLCADQDDWERFVRAMLWWPDAILRTLPFEPRKPGSEPRIVLIPPECKGDYCQEELVICCTRFGFIEKITLRAYFALLQMRIDQEQMALTPQ